MNEADSYPEKLTITDVQTQRRRAERRSIFINGEFAFGVSEEMYVKYALFKGREVSHEFIETVRNEENLFQARQTAMRYVGHRMRSEFEIRKKLAEKEFSPETIEATLRFLAEYRMLDDAQFARSYINDQLLKRPIGRRRIESELRRKGISKEEIGEAVNGVIGNEDELRNALVAAEKKAQNLRSDDRQKWERSMANFLANRGFGWEAIGKVLAHYREQAKENQEHDER